MPDANDETIPRHAANRQELLLVGLFSLLAAACVFVFTAAFPFFSHVDEHHHFDLFAGTRWIVDGTLRAIQFLTPFGRPSCDV